MSQYRTCDVSKYRICQISKYRTCDTSEYRTFHISYRTRFALHPGIAVSVVLLSYILNAKFGGIEGGTAGSLWLLCTVYKYRIENSDISEYRTFHASYRRRFSLHPLAPPYLLCWYADTRYVLNEKFRRIEGGAGDGSSSRIDFLFALRSLRGYFVQSILLFLLVAPMLLFYFFPCCCFLRYS